MVSAYLSTGAADVRFVRIGTADARTVSRLREDFSHWLGNLALDRVRLSDVVLAVNEALSNAAEFAYAGRAHSDTMTIQARYEAATDSMNITVADHGEWRESDPDTQKLSRGRGIPLMRLLADHVAINPSPRGTRVQLRFDDCLLGAASRTPAMTGI